MSPQRGSKGAWKAHPVVLIIATIFMPLDRLRQGYERVATHKLNVNDLPVEISIARMVNARFRRAMLKRDEDETICLTCIFFSILINDKHTEKR